LKLGPSATKAVLAYLDDPDADLRKEARGLCEQLQIPADVQLEQTLADVADARKPRARTALERLARLRPDEASRAKVSLALNAPLLDPDARVRTEALNAVRVWGSKENTATLLTLLGKLQNAGPGRDPRVIEVLGLLQDPAAAPALADGLTHPQECGFVVKSLTAIGPGAEYAVIPYLQSTVREARFAACAVLADVGTPKSLPALEAAGTKTLADVAFYQCAQLAAEKIMARK
jgi:HEAT repeat protein